MTAAKSYPQPRDRDVFVVRRWRSPADGSWRSQIVHVSSGRMVNFGSDAELLAYLERRLRAQAEATGRSGLR